MTQKDFYEKHKDYIHAYFSGERVEILYEDGSWDDCSSRFFTINEFSKPGTVQFRIVKPKETPKLPDEWDEDLNMSCLEFDDVRDYLAHLMRNQNLFRQYIKAKEGE